MHRDSRRTYRLDDAENEKSPGRSAGAVPTYLFAYKADRIASVCQPVGQVFVLVS
jgi:hypothetical protein